MTHILCCFVIVFVALVFVLKTPR